MAVQKPRTTVNRKNTSVRVTKKKQGVTKKQGLVAAAVLALVGVIVVVATHAATAPNKVYVLSTPPKGTYTNNLTRVATDGSSKSSYSLNFLNRIDLSRDKLLLAGNDSGSTISVFNAADGSGKTQVACPSVNKLDCNGRQKIWLPGGKRFAYFEIGSAGTTKTLAVNTDGTNPKVLFTDTGQKSTTCLSLNKAGTKLLLSQYDWALSQKARFYTMNIDGSSQKLIATLDYRGEGSVSCPSWAPSGEKIAFIRTTTINPYKVDMRTINQDGTGLTTVKNLFTGEGSNYGVDSESFKAGFYGMINNSMWSPGSSSILYWAKRNGTQNLYQLNISTKQVKAVTSNQSGSTAISMYGWSSDGRIVYAYGPAGSCANGTCTTDQATTLKSVDSSGQNAKILHQAASGTYFKSITF